MFETELAFFEEHRAEWVNVHLSKYALIKGEHLEGMYASNYNAYVEGVNRWGNVPFLIKEVLREDRVEQSPALVHGLIYAGYGVPSQARS